jgi:predicted amidophosphoribosyltransferase
MRRGRVFRRCTRCNAEVGRRCPQCRAHLPERSRRCPSCGADTSNASRQCARCGSTSITWGYRVDVSRPGEPRRQRYRTGFTTKAEAVEALNEEQKARSDGTYVERSKITVGEYLDRWLASGPTAFVAAP